MGKTNIKGIILAFIIGIMVLVILIQITSFVLAILGAILGFFIGYTIFKEKILKDIKENLKEDVKEVDLSQKAIEDIIDLEEFIALSDNKFEEEIFLKISDVIEALLKVLPLVNEKFSQGSLIFEITNLASEHFPNRVKSFLDLNKDTQKLQQSKFLIDLDNMQEVVKKVCTIIDNDSLNKNERESLLSDIKYSAI